MSMRVLTGHWVFLLVWSGTALGRQSLPASDCNQNGIDDSSDIQAGTSRDCNANGLPDECELPFNDSNFNGLPDDCDIQAGTSHDCNSNGVPDEVDLAPSLRFSAATGLLGTEPEEVTLADLDGDGDLDLATTELSTGGSVSILVNQGGRRFLRRDRLFLGDVPIFLTSSDLDADGDLDLLISLHDAFQADAPGRVAVLLNRGDAAFVPAQDLPMQAPQTLAAGDWDGDSDPDLVIVSGPELFLYLNNGRATFAPAGRLDAPNYPSFVRAADLDGDADLDLALASSFNPGPVLTYLNDGHAVFSPGPILAAGLSQSSLDAADMDGDGKLDLVLGINSETADAVLIRNLGNGKFAQGEFLAFGPSVIHFTSSPVVVHDLDGDGDLDLASSGMSREFSGQDGPSLLSVLLNEGKSSFEPPRHFTAPGNAECVAAGDLDGDQKPDLVFQNHDVSALSFVWNVGDGAFIEPRHFDSGQTVLSIAAADLDGDGNPDLAVAHPFSVGLFINQGKGSFAQGRQIPVGSSPIAVMAADLDGDGDNDLVTVNSVISGSIPNNVSVLLNQGKAIFAAPRNYAVGLSPTSMVAGDLNGDQKIDLAVLNSGSADVSLLFNLGDGTFAPAATFAVAVPRPISIAAGDLDGDSDLDLAVADDAFFVPGNEVKVFLNDGKGRFSAGTVLSVGLGPPALVAGDLDGDGDVDLAAASGNSGSISVHLNSGVASFAPASIYSVESFPLSVTLSDLDLDGDLDIGSANVTTEDDAYGNVSILQNRGDGTFLQAMNLAVGFLPVSIVASDLDGDKDPDLVLPTFDGHVAIIENQLRPWSLDRDQNQIPDECEGGPATKFIRGDVNEDAKVDVADVIALLEFLFKGGKPPGCGKAADATDDGALNLTDAIRIVFSLFAGQGALPEPFGRCGFDPTGDALDCAHFLPCRVSMAAFHSVTTVPPRRATCARAPTEWSQFEKLFEECEQALWTFSGTLPPEPRRKGAEGRGAFAAALVRTCTRVRTSGLVRTSARVMKKLDTTNQG